MIIILHAARQGICLFDLCLSFCFMSHRNETETNMITGPGQTGQNETKGAPVFSKRCDNNIYAVSSLTQDK